MAKGENIFKRKDGRWEGRYIKGKDSLAEFTQGETVRLYNPGHPTDYVDATVGTKESNTVAITYTVDTHQVTGYIRGGCSPIGMKKRFPTYFHSTATELDVIYVSAGVRGLQLEMSPSDLITFVGAEVADVAI